MDQLGEGLQGPRRRLHLRWSVAGAEDTTLHLPDRPLRRRLLD